ncbi:hypothetical protein [Nocardia beijingensis]
MLFETIRMWTDPRTMVHLHDVLTRFQPNDWRWRIEEFEGVGRFPGGGTWTEFDAGVEAGTAVFDWEESSSSLTVWTR